MSGIYEIRPDLEGLHHQAPGAQGGHNAQCDRGLAHAAVGAGDEKSRNATV